MPLIVVEYDREYGTTLYYFDCSVSLMASYEVWDYSSIQNVSKSYIKDCATGWSCQTGTIATLDNQARRKEYEGTADFYMLNTYRGTRYPHLLIVI